MGFSPLNNLTLPRFRGPYRSALRIWLPKNASLGRKLLERIIEADVDRRRRLGDAADGDEVDAGLGDGPDGVEIDPAGRLERDPAGNLQHSVAQHVRLHVVEQ